MAAMWVNALGEDKLFALLNTSMKHFAGLTVSTIVANCIWLLAT